MITILGLPQLQAKQAALPLVVAKAAEVGRQQGAERIAANASSQAPQLTGAMGESVSTDGESVEVGVPYAPFVEGGTVHMAAQPFLEPAFDQEQTQVVDDIANAVRVAITAL